ncbi:glycosyl hydrolase family 28-related protein [Pigmentiphaga soli]|uniref:glycosyl hydrolase family 28-related protein n=1 Tax=Pigmentiphaga soli TaxID=1007095 RepID=UPI0031ED447C
MKAQHSPSYSRRILLGRITSILGAILTARPAAVIGADSNDKPISVKDYGAKGDGVTDDYASIKEAVRKINEQKGGTLIFPKGTYYIGAIKDLRDPSQDWDITFSECRGLTIDLQGSSIVVRGNFRRSADVKAARGYVSFKNTVIPIKLVNCQDCHLRNGTLLGGVGELTRDSGVVEGPCHGVMINGGADIYISDLTVRDFAADGVYIAPSPSAQGKKATRIRLDRVTSTNNARQGMSIVGGIGIRADGCYFGLTGIVKGAYGNHPPSAGVDVEPNVKPRDGNYTGQIEFINCKFDRNKGHNFVASSPESTASITLSECTFIGDAAARGQAFYAGAVNTYVQDCVIRQCTFMNCALMPGYAHRTSANPSSTKVENCTFSITKLRTPSIYVQSKLENLHITLRQNVLYFEPSGDIPRYFIQISNKGVEFTQNKIFVSAHKLLASGARPRFALQGISMYSDNEWIGRTQNDINPSQIIGPTKEESTNDRFLLDRTWIIPS